MQQPPGGVANRRRDLHDHLSDRPRAQAEAPRWFSRMPTAGCAVAAVGGGPLAFYTGPSPDGGFPHGLETMHRPKRWTIAPPQTDAAELASRLKVSPLIAQILLTADDDGVMFHP